MNILLVKLGALGDVLRTTPLLTALKAKHPSARVTWLVDTQCQDVLRDNPLIDELLNYSSQNLTALSKRNFDLLINLDKEPEALEAATQVQASKKMGFGRSPEGVLRPLNDLSDYAYRLGIDDDLKFRKNKKTYQEISFEQVGLSFKGEEYIFPLDAASASYAEKYLKGLGVDLSRVSRPILGLNTGSGSRFAGKRLPVGTYVELARRFSEDLGATVFLLGGKDELDRNKEIERLSGGLAVNTGSHSIRQFAAIVKQCDLIVSGDTTAMHIAIAVKTPVVVHFGSTCSAEIELYGRGKKIVSPIECAPCYKRICPIDDQCMKDMSVDEIASSVKDLLGRKNLSEKHSVS